MKAYDPLCLTYPTAVRAAWQLNRRGRKQALSVVGLDTVEARRAFALFTKPTLTQAAVRRLVQTHPTLVDAATTLIGAYTVLYSSEIKQIDEYYEEKERASDEDVSRESPA